MEKISKNFRKYILITLVIAVPLSFAGGYAVSQFLMATTTPVCPGQATLAEVQANNSTFSRDANANPSGIRSITVSKAEFGAMNCINTQASSSTAFRIYYGEDNRGVKSNYVMGISNTTVNTSLIYKIQGSVPVNCPPICDISDPVTNNPL